MQPVLSDQAVQLLSDPDMKNKDVAWVITSIISHWLLDCEPSADETPKHLAVAWRIVLAGQNSIKNGVAEKHERRVSAANKRWNKTQCNDNNATQSIQCNAMHSNVHNAMHKVREGKVREDKIITEEKKETKKRSTTSASVSSASDLSSVDILTTREGYQYQEYAGKKEFLDPVEYALWITCETDTTRNRNCYGKYLKALGKKEFIDICSMFDAEMRAGEIPNNAGAALNARLKARMR